MLADRINARKDAVRTVDPVTMEEFDAILGSSTGYSATTKAGTSVSAKRALGLSAWYSGVRYLSEVMAGLPVHRYRDTPTGRKRVASPPWMKRPDVERPWYSLIELIMMGLLHQGNGHAFKLREASTGQVVGLRGVQSERVTGGTAPDGTKRFAIDRNENLFTTREILHVPGLSYNGQYGLNPIQYSADVLGAAAATDDYASRFFSNSTNLGGVISVEHAMSEPQAAALKAEWEAFHKGILNSHRTGVLSKGARYDRVTLDAASSQLLESRSYGVLEVARLLRLPPHKLYELTNATFSNIEHQSIEAITDGIQPWCERIESCINYDPDLTPEGTFIKFELEGRLRGDTASRYQSYTAAIGGPWMAPNEARILEDRPPIPGGDVVLSPLNMQPVGAERPATTGGQPS